VAAHADVVHGPDAGAHGDSSADEPEAADGAVGGVDAAGEFEGGIGGGDGDEDGEGDEAEVVVADEDVAGERHERPGAPSGPEGDECG